MNSPVYFNEFKDLFEYAVEKHKNTNDPVPEMGKNNVSKIESCLNTPFMTFGGSDLYETIFDKASILFYLLIKNHPLQNGNKRMAYITVSYLLHKNGIKLIVSNDEIYEFTKKIASSESSEKDNVVIDINKFIINHSKQIDNINMTKQELKDKIAKIKGNSALPEKQRQQLLDKFEPMLKELEEKETKEPVEAISQADFEELVEMAEKDKEGAKKARSIYDSYSKKQKESLSSWFSKTDAANEGNEKNFKYLISDKNIKHKEKSETKVKEKSASKSEPSKSTKPSYNCDDLVKEAKERHKKKKEAAAKRAEAEKKPEVKKAAEKIDRTHSSIEKKVEKGEFNKAQLKTLIDETKDLLKMLEKALGKL